MKNSFFKGLKATLKQKKGPKRAKNGFLLLERGCA